MAGFNVDIARGFIELEQNEWDESTEHLAHALRKVRNWDDILKNRASVVVASANAGKTTELRLKSAHLRATGSAACFVSVRELSSHEPLLDALEPAESKALTAWLENGLAGPLYLFVDSIDEAALERASDLRTALRKLARAVELRAANVYWVLSTRPAALNHAVIDAITQALGISFPTSTSISIIGTDMGQAASAMPEPAESGTPSVLCYRLAALTRTQAARYLQAKHGIENANAVIEAAYAHGMSSLLLSPGKLNLLRDLDLVAHPPHTLHSLYEKCVALHLRAPAGERSEIANVPVADLRHEVARLACASSLCEKLNIALPADDEPMGPSALSARAIVSRLRDSGLRFLMSSGLFEDSGHHQVKLQPDDTRMFLAAERLNQLVLSSKDAENVMRVLGWRAQTGETGIFALLLPVAGWLATMNRFFFHECIRVDPQAVAFFGDLRSMKVEDARLALERTAERVAAGERLGHGAYTLTSENYWQAGPPQLGSTISALFAQYSGNENVKDMLVAIAQHARLPELRTPLLASLADDYSQILSDDDLLLYFLVVGSEADLAALRTAALASSELSERAVRLLIRFFAWTHFSAIDLAVLTQKCMGSDEAKYVLTLTLTDEAGALANNSQLLDLTTRLHTLLLSEIPDEDMFFSKISDLEWLGETVATLLSILVTRNLAPDEVLRVARLIRELQQNLLVMDAGRIDVKELRAVLAKPTAVRFALITELMEHRSAGESLWVTFFVHRPLVIPSLAEARELGVPDLVDLAEEVASRVDSKPEKLAEAVPETGTSSHAKDIESLVDREAAIRAGTDGNALAWVAQILANGPRYGEVSTTNFRRDYGDNLANAVQEGLARYWRDNEPRREEANPNTTYWTTIAGLQGISLELSESVAAIAALDEAEVPRALDYGLYELNGVPQWFWPLADMHLESATRFLVEVLRNAKAGALSHVRAMKVLTNLGKAPPLVQAALAPTVWEILKSRTDLDRHQLAEGLVLVTSTGTVSVPEFSQEAERRWALPDNPHSVVWAANALLYAPQRFLDSLKSSDDVESNTEFAKFVESLAAYLEDERGMHVAELASKNPIAITALKELYIALRTAVKPEDDEPRRSFTVYHIDETERARRLRDRLPTLIASVNNMASYVALRELAQVATVSNERHWMEFLMRRIAETMQKVPPMMAADFLEFETRLRRVPGSEEAFAQEVENDLEEVKELVEQSDFSPRRFIGTSYIAAAESVIQAMEDEFQLFLAGQLDLIGRKRYHVVREEQLAEDTRRDVSIMSAVGKWKATLELKVSLGGWTLQDYRDSVRNQLVGRYMKQRHTNIGFFVILLQKNRKWHAPGGGSLTFDELIAILKADAVVLQTEKPNLRLRIIGIDATEPLGTDGQPLRRKARN